jgi:glycosyltransferase involved in cell wall biosynthesis
MVDRDDTVGAESRALADVVAESRETRCMNQTAIHDPVPTSLTRDLPAATTMPPGRELPQRHVLQLDKPVRVAIVHDWLVTYAGAERVLEQLIACFPDADIFSLVDFLEDRSCLRGRPVMTSFLQNFPRARRNYRAYLPLMPLAIEQFDLSSYDVVISSSHAVAKGVLTGPDQIHVSYVHSPIRYAWDMQHQYLQQSNLKRGVRSILARLVLHYIRTWDVRTANSVDVFVANSEFIARRIKKVYRRDAHVVFPPVDIDAFPLHLEKGEFYLTASRLVPYKKVDLIVEAFAKMPARRLVVIGDGPEMHAIRAKAAPNVEIMGYQPFTVLRNRMQRAKAFLTAAEEDFGISTVEAQACGTPVIAYCKGASAEIVRDLGGPRPTGLFFDEQRAESIIVAVERFEARHNLFAPGDCRANAERFSASYFRENFLALVGAAAPALQGTTLSTVPGLAGPDSRDSDPLHVLAIDQSGELGGAEFSLLQIVKELRARTGVLLFDDGPFRAALEEAGVPVQVLDSGALRNVHKQGNVLPGTRALACIAALVRATVARARDVDLIYVNTQRAMVVGAVAGRLAGRPVVWHLRDIVSRDHFGTLQRTVIKWCARFGLARVIANSHASAQAFTVLTGFDDSRVNVIYEGISAAPFEALRHIAPKTLREGLNLPQEAFLVGSFSRLAHWKGQHVLLEALLQEPHTHAVLVGAPLFGEDAYEAELRAFVARHDLSARVHFLGFQRDIPACMAAVDVVVHTSVLPEPLGRVIVEGMLAQRPVVAARAGGVTEIIQDGDNGLLCAPGDATELASALAALRSDTRRRARLAERGFQTARRQFDETASVEKIERVLREGVSELRYEARNSHDAKSRR